MDWESVKLIHFVLTAARDVAPLKRKRGRPRNSPPTLLTGLRLPQKQGAPVIFTPELERWLVATIDRLQAAAAADGRRLTVIGALRANHRHLIQQRLIAGGLSRAAAQRQAYEEAAKWERLPDLENG